MILHRNPQEYNKDNWVLEHRPLTKWTRNINFPFEFVSGQKVVCTTHVQFKLYKGKLYPLNDLAHVKDFLINRFFLPK